MADGHDAYSRTLVEMGGENSSEPIEKVARRVFISISRLSLFPVDEITLDTTIDYRLAIDGDDVDDLLLSIDPKNQIDWTGFNYYDYFMDEGQISAMITLSFFLWPMILVIRVFQLFFPQFRKGKRSKTPKDLTVRDLIGTVYNRSWRERHKIPGLEQELLSAWAKQYLCRFNRRYKKKA